MKLLHYLCKDLAINYFKFTFTYPGNNYFFFSCFSHIYLGGDPTGTGKGGVSIYGRTFDDEIHEELKHTG